MKRFIQIPENFDFGTEAGLSEITIVRWCVKERDRIPAGVIVEVEGAKVAQEIEATDEQVGAVLTKILVLADETISVHLPLTELPKLAEIEIADVPSAAGPEKATAEISTDRETQGSFVGAIATRAVRRVLASPLARKIAKEHGVDLDAMTGEGPGGRIIMRQVEAEIERQKSIGGSNERIIKPSPRRLRTVLNLQAGAAAIPLAGDTITVDARRLDALRRDMAEFFDRLHGEKLRFDHFVGKAAAWLLRHDFPILNAYWREPERDVALHSSVNLGVAVSFPRTTEKQSELVIASVKDAASHGFADFVREANRVIRAAHDGAASASDLSGATMVVNNVGSSVEWRGKRYAGGEDPHSVLAPQTALIIAFGAIRDGALRLAMRFDHRVTDGEEPIAFTRALGELLEHPEQILAL